VNHAAFDGDTCGLGAVLPGTTDDQSPIRHRAGEWRLKSSASPVGQIGEDRSPPDWQFAITPSQENTGSAPDCRRWRDDDGTRGLYVTTAWTLIAVALRESASS